MLGRVISVNNIDIWYDTFGNEADQAILLIMGNSAQGIMWPDDFCQTIASNNRYVIRFDNRDTGLSTCLDFDEAPYNLFDLAKDALSLLDTLQIKKAHIVGLSMGGSIAQLLAITNADRIYSITSMMSSPDLSIKNDAFMGKDTSQAKLPPPKKEFVEAVIALNKSIPTNKQEKIKLIVNNWRLANGGRAQFDENYWQLLIKKAMTREELNPTAKNLKFANHGNHSKAQMATTEPNLNTLKAITVPVLVIHGKEDPIFPPAHAEVVSNTVLNGKLLLIDDMGHALNPLFFNKIITAIIDHTHPKSYEK